jgi:hypothetical protein
LAFVGWKRRVIAASGRSVKMWAEWGEAMGLILGRFCAAKARGKRLFPPARPFAE